jgi:hypothetical protein
MCREHPDISQLSGREKENLRKRKQGGILAIPYQDGPRPAWGREFDHDYVARNPLTRFQSDCRPPGKLVALQHFTRRVQPMDASRQVLIILSGTRSETRRTLLLEFMQFIFCLAQTTEVGFLLFG